ASLPKISNYIWEQLAEDRLAASFIVDGHHLPEGFLRAAVRAKSIERCILVTDAVAPAGCAPGEFRLGRVNVTLEDDGRVVLRGTHQETIKGRLAGSALTMDRAVANMMRSVGVSLMEAVTMATTNPARVGRVPGRRRGFTPGERSDVVL